MTALFFLGLAAIVAGTTIIFPPAALIVAGLLAALVALRAGGDA
jgi:hypothetical protein